MILQENETPEQTAGTRLSTADLAAANGKSVGTEPTAVSTPQEGDVPLFAQSETQDFRSRWEQIQAGFVDEPRTAVANADELVANAIKRLAEIFAAERHKLETEWAKTDGVSTEDLRLALRRYRSFFGRILSV